MPHKIEISDKTYEYLKEFCRLNDLKIGQYADKLIYDNLMIEMYGDVPFTDYKKLKLGTKEIPFLQQIAKEFPPEKFEQEYLAQPEPIREDEVKFIEGPPIREEFIKEKEKLEEKILEEVGVPKKVMNRITKRRLK